MIFSYIAMPHIFKISYFYLFVIQFLLLIKKDICSLYLKCNFFIINFMTGAFEIKFS